MGLDMKLNPAGWRSAISCPSSRPTRGRLTVRAGRNLKWRSCSLDRPCASFRMPVAQRGHQDGDGATCEKNPAKISECGRYRENGCLAARSFCDKLQRLQMRVHRIGAGVGDVGRDRGDSRLMSIRIKAGIGEELG